MTVASVELGPRELAVLALLAFGVFAVICSGGRVPRDGRRRFAATERAAILEAIASS